MKLTILILLVMLMNYSHFQAKEIIFCANHVDDTCKTVERKFVTSQKNPILADIIIDCETQKPLKVGVLNVNEVIFTQIV